MGREQKLNVLAVDDHPVFLLGLERAFSSQNKKMRLMTAGGAEEGIALYKKHKPHIVLMDIKMKPVTGVEATKKILEEFPSAKIIGHSMHDEPEHIYNIIKAGACGYIIKESAVDEIFHAIREVHAGRHFYSASVSEILMKFYEEVKGKGEEIQPAAPLTKREKEVLQLLISNFSLKESAKQLNIGERTVESHRNNIYLKAGTHDSAALFLYASKLGIKPVIKK
jgi:two-component system, NarL family, nitrate/nitrite response regulator NarL